jgi:predicted nucleotidyltransferase component of viral defense system
MRNPDSIKAKLKQLAIQENKPFDYVMMHYFIERLLYRLSISQYAENFVLKGGLLLYTMLKNDARATKDIDFLARQLSNTPDELIDNFRKVCAIESDDAIRFDLDSITAERIKEDADYEGVRIKVTGYLGKSRHVLQFDIGFGDVIVPKPMPMEYPSLLDMERPQLKAYSCESVISEKFEAMIALAEANSRMKDFYDVYILSRMFDFEGLVLYEAVSQTLQRRGTPLTAVPTVFSDEFPKLKDKQTQWKAFQKRIRVSEGVEFPEIIAAIKAFIQPVYAAVIHENEWMKSWSHEETRWLS